MNDVSPIKKGRKYDQVLDGARSVFLADGYEGASVDAIARAAGVSKATLYSYFTDKKMLFMEVAKAECRTQIEESSKIMEEYASPEAVLRDNADRAMTLILSQFGQSIFRMCVAESDRFPELGREFYRTGPAVFHERMCAYLSEAVRRGDLRIEDVDLASHQFIELCHAQLFAEMVFGIRKSVEPDEKKRVIDGAVETFLARYGA